MLDLFSIPVSVPGLPYRIALAVIFTGAAAYYDVFNKKWVPNSLVYGFAFFAVAINFIFFDPAITWPALAFGVIAFLLSYGLYKLGQLGGADAYALGAIAATVPYLPSPLLSASHSAPYPFILSVLAPTGFAFILHMAFRFVPYISRRMASGKISFTPSKAAGPAAIAFAFMVFLYILISLPFAFPPTYIALLIFLAIALVFFSLFKSEIKESMVEMVPVLRLQEEDVLALEEMGTHLVQKLSLHPVLTKKSIAALRKAKVKSVPVYTGMPFFLPYLFFGLLFTVLFGDMLMYLIG